MQEQATPFPDFRALFEGAPGLYLVLTPDLVVAAASDAYTRAAMVTRAALIGRSIFDVFPDDPADHDETGLRASLARVAELKRPDAMPARQCLTPRPLAAGGGFEQRYWSAINTPVLDANGELCCVIHRIEDVSELMRLSAKEAEQAALIAEQQRRIDELRQTNRLLAQRLDDSAGRHNEREHQAAQQSQAEKMEALGTLTGGVAHDVNNLLGIIIGNLDLLRDQKNDDASVDLIGEAQGAAQRGAELARRLLAFARRQPLQPARVAVNDLLRQTAADLAGALTAGVGVTLDLADDLWPVMIDPAQLATSLSQLAINAGDAMPEGGRLIIGSRNSRLDADYAGEHPEVQPGDYVIIEISDTGRGMSHEVQRRIFEPFFTTKEKGKGGGLGLSTVLGFIKQSGGHIDVASEEGVGTTFRLYLPRLGVDARLSEPKAPARAAAGGGETVLVVEDDPAMRRVVRRQLYELGYQVLEADRATAALRVLETEKIDLLFTDIVTPGSIDGIALARTAAARWPEIKILLTSGFPQTRLDERGEVNGMRLLSKPYGREDLARVLREVLEAGRDDEGQMIRAG